MNNNWLSNDGKQIDRYLSSKDLILVERARQLRIFVDLFEFCFEKRQGLNLLDFGCGDGALSCALTDRYPDNAFCLLDGSEAMLEKAKEKLASHSARFVRRTFEEFIRENEEECTYDFVYSSMAIHHLPHHQKRELYSIFSVLLKPGGLFVNMDVVLPTSKSTEEFQFGLWTGWINEEIARRSLESEKGRHDDLPDVYKNKPENKPSSLASQLSMLEDTGFTDVECHYKYGIFALFSGRKL